jgi:two-component system chemotaxis sensor kinase CheA
VAGRGSKTRTSGGRKAGRRKANQEFVSEAEEILERMREDLADLDDARNAGRRVDPDVINQLFRSAHSLKALAGMFGLETIQDLSHNLEDILDGLRLGRVALDSPVVGMIDEAVRLFANLLGNVGDEEALEAIAAPVEDLSQRIEAVGKPTEPAVDAFESLDIDASLLRALTEYEEHRLRENIESGQHIAMIDSTFEIASFEDGLNALSTGIREVGEVLSTLPAPGDTPESQIRFSLLVASELPLEALLERLDFPEASARSVLVAQGETGAAVPSPQPSARVPEDHQVPALPDETHDPVREVESLRSLSETVRVDIRKLDELMNLVGELAIQRVSIADIASRLSADPQTARVGGDLAKLEKSLDRKLKGMQSAVLDVRMVPMRQVFDKVSRVVRALRRDLGKDVRLEVVGADTELDKLIVEELIDPVMHIVRNAIDHAIESLDQRVSAGKEPQGMIRIEAFQRGNHVVIAVTDDGRGIDGERLRDRAVERGLVAPDETLTPRETLDLIFEAGITTRTEVTDTSGRGVGMDVVRANVSAIGGVVDVESTPGRGTTISMTLPITLAIIQSLIVSVGRHRFAIPMNSVLETLLIETDEIQHSEGRELLNLRGEALTLRRLSHEFELEVEESARTYAVVVGLGDTRIGLLVDRLDGQQDTVIKPIHGPVQTVRGIAGATELGAQDPVLVLDVASLVEDAVRRRDAA